ncbi:MAG: hypothetical protein R3C44_18735 [Chloroflexota bacterium]
MERPILAQKCSELARRSSIKASRSGVQIPPQQRHHTIQTHVVIHAAFVAQRTNCMTVVIMKDVAKIADFFIPGVTL